MRHDALRNAFECEPVLLDETIAVIAARLICNGQLIANAGRLEFAIPRHAPEKHVPPRQQYAEIASVRGAFVTIADRVVPPMERRAHEQALAKPAEMHPDIGVLD